MGSTSILFLKEGNNMALKVRRIVTGYDVSGKSVVKTDEQLTAVSRFGGIAGCEV